MNSNLIARPFPKWERPLFFLLIAICAQSRLVSAQNIERVESSSLISYFTSDSLQGRPSGTVHEKAAAQYISNSLIGLGLSPVLRPFVAAVDDKDTLNSINVTAYRNNGADSTIVFCAHYDHLGMGSGKSKEIVKKCVHPGADDNASGVAVLLELVRQLMQDSTSARFDYLFLFPSAHEIGLYGSKTVVQSRLLDTLKIRAVINLDMVGRMDAREHRVRVNHCFKGIDSIFNDRAADAVRITTEDASMITNDLTIFCEAALPAMSITTGLHQDYHRCSDTADKLNYAGMVEIKDLLIHMLKKL